MLNVLLLAYSGRRCAGKSSMEFAVAEACGSISVHGIQGAACDNCFWDEMHSFFAFFLLSIWLMVSQQLQRLITISPTPLISSASSYLLNAGSCSCRSCWSMLCLFFMPAKTGILYLQDLLVNAGADASSMQSTAGLCSPQLPQAQPLIKPSKHSMLSSIRTITFLRTRIQTHQRPSMHSVQARVQLQLTVLSKQPCHKARPVTPTCLTAAMEQQFPPGIHHCQDQVTLRRLKQMQQGWRQAQHLSRQQ